MATPTAFLKSADALSWLGLFFFAIACAASFSPRKPQKVVMNPATLPSVTSTFRARNMSLTRSMTSARGPFVGVCPPRNSPSKPGSTIGSALPSVREWSSLMAEGTSCTPESWTPSR